MRKFWELLRDCLLAVPVLMLGNTPLLWKSWEGGVIWLKILLLVLSALGYLTALALPGRKKSGSRKLGILSKGLQLFRTGCISIVAEFFLLGSSVSSLLQSNMMIAPAPEWLTSGTILLNLLIYAVVIIGMLSGGVLRIIPTAKQIKPTWYFALLLFWWFPGVNLYLFGHMLHLARQELYFERARLELDMTRQESEICKTKYPILMVHGIFFRDWHFVNYWGRIPEALQRNGARIFYGKQQSAQPVAASAEELHQQIQAVLRETSAEKVNIIAHSKGGLDSRYAISVLGDAPYVASLTTVSTPHYGCAWVTDALQKIPANVQQWLAARYEAIFRKLGDKNPDFLGGVSDLTPEACAKLNKLCPNAPGVVYQCFMSKMNTFCSAPFPLWLGYLCMKAYDRHGTGDGLVPIESAQLRDVPFQMVPATKGRGISHGDMIDLSKENIPGFDVREFYIQLVKHLKDQGF